MFEKTEKCEYVYVRDCAIITWRAGGGWKIRGGYRRK